MNAGHASLHWRWIEVWDEQDHDTGGEHECHEGSSWPGQLRFVCLSVGSPCYHHLRLDSGRQKKSAEHPGSREISNMPDLGFSLVGRWGGKSLSVRQRRLTGWLTGD